MVADIIGVSPKSVYRHRQCQLESDRLPACITNIKRVARRIKWETAANNVEPFIVDLIRDTIFHKYRSQITIKLESLRNELCEQLKKDDISFHPSLSHFGDILKGIGFRYSKINNRNIIFEREDITNLRINYLRQESKRTYLLDIHFIVERRSWRREAQFSFTKTKLGFGRESDMQKHGSIKKLKQTQWPQGKNSIRSVQNSQQQEAKD